MRHTIPALYNSSPRVFRSISNLRINNTRHSEAEQLKSGTALWRNKFIVRFIGTARQSAEIAAFGAEADAAAAAAVKTGKHL
jgi:hypothetical protein